MKVKRKHQYLKRNLYIIFFVIFMFVLVKVTGCNNKEQIGTEMEVETQTEKETEIKIQVFDSKNKAEHFQKNNNKNIEEIVDIGLKLYEDAAKEHKLDNLETIRRIINQFGEKGYSAVDSKNQIDMVQAEQVIQFCEMVDAKQETKIIIIEVTYESGFIIYDLHTKDGNINIVRSHYKYQNGTMKNIVTGSYLADYWNYTENGYFMFSGCWFSEELYVLTLSEPEQHTAFRVLPLDETCRELNRKYILPIGYEKNNMFLVDWSEEDFGNLNFYDMYDIFYPKIEKQPIPYTADENLSVGAVYQIPKTEFERIIMAYFNVDSETLQAKTTYYAEEETYEYKPRGFFEVEYPEYPYSEVVKFTENNNGTLTLTVNVVFPYACNASVYVHEVVVRPLEGGGIQYVSNRIIDSKDNDAETWHTPRLTEERWKEVYIKKQLQKNTLTAADEAQIAEQSEKGYNLPVNEYEREEAEIDCKRMMQHYFDIYKNTDKGKSLNIVLDKETMQNIQNKVKQTGFPVTTTIAYSNMENYESVDSFLKACIKGKSGTVIVYEIHSDGGIGRMKYLFDGTDMFVLSAKAAWNKENEPQITYISYTRIKEWKYTKKGWFCYQLCVPEYPEVTEVIDGSFAVRVKPMSEENRRLSQKCVQGLGYQGNNLLCSNWDITHMENLDYNGVYEYLYKMKYQKNLDAKDVSDGILKEAFESLIMEYFPITAAQIQTYAIFDEEKQVYAWEELGCANYTPTYFGTSLPEVTGIQENADGTVTLTIEAVCDMVLCDDALITHKLTVRFAEDGSFQYLGNKILEDGMENVPEYQHRVRFFIVKSSEDENKE